MLQPCYSQCLNLGICSHTVLTKKKKKSQQKTLLIHLLLPNLTNRLDVSQLPLSEEIYSPKWRGCGAAVKKSSDLLKSHSCKCKSIAFWGPQMVCSLLKCHWHTHLYVFLRVVLNMYSVSLLGMCAIDLWVLQEKVFKKWNEFFLLKF